MGVRMKIDHRESKIKALINKESVTCPIEFENMEHGDIIIYYADIPVYVFERKTIPDLRASINDGRYRNQKLKMMDQYHRGQIYYIIEGDCPLTEEGVTGAIINTMLRDKIGIFRTKDIYDTLRLLYDVVNRFQKDPHKYISSCDDQLRPSLTNRKESIFVNMLCQIPHISVKTANAIQAKYTSFEDLHMLFEHKSRIERIKSLQDIMVLDKGGKNRRISATACESLVNSYYGER